MFDPNELPPGWREQLGPEFEKPYMLELASYLQDRVDAGAVLCPKREDIFRAFQLTDLPDVRVVIIGQDPYPDPDNACGLAFAAPATQPVPASLRNIFLETCSPPVPSHMINWRQVSPDLTHWAQQGVLLLNAALTTEASNSGAHVKRWKPWTEAVLRVLASQERRIIFMLWGANARAFKPQVDNGRNSIIEASHPSPLARGFRGGRYFDLANGAFSVMKQPPIDWAWKTKETR